MRKTRLVILPGVRSLNTIGCLLLFLACPTIAFKGQENREVEALCKAQDLKEFWLQDSPWPGDLGVLQTRNDDLGLRPRLDTLTKHTCNVDASNRKVRGVKLESQRTLPMERRIVAERRETTRRLDSSVDSRSRSQDNVLDSRRLAKRIGERVAEVRAEMNTFSDERRQLDERKASTYRADARMVNTRERISRENGSRRDLNQMDRSNTRSVGRQIRFEDREERVGTENMRRSLSVDRRTRAMENSRNDIRIRSQLQDRDVTATPRKSELRVDGKNTRREGEIKDTQRESNSGSRSDAMRIRQEATRSTAQLHEAVRTIRERLDGGVRRMESSRRDQNVRNNQRYVRREENRWNLGEMRMDRDDIRDFKLPARGRRVARYTRSIEDVRQTDRRARGAAHDKETMQADIRREDSRRETTSVERVMERTDRNRDDVRRRQIDIRNTRSLEDVERTDRRARISTREDRREDNRRNSENRMQTRSIEREMQARDSIRIGIRNIREDIIEGSKRVRDSRNARTAGSDVERRQLDRTARAASDDNRIRQVESRRIGDVRRETRSMERKMEHMDRNREDVRRRQNDNRNIQSLEDVERSDRRARISTREDRREDNRRNSENRMQTRSIEREMQARDSIRTGIRNIHEDISEGSKRVRDSRNARSAGSDVEMRQLDRTARAASDDNRIRQVDSRRIGDVRRETRSMERKVERMDRNREDVRRRQNDNRNIQSLEDVERSDRRARISTREDRREDNRRNSENIIQTRSREREMQARDSIRIGIRNIREDIIEGSKRVRDSRNARTAGSDLERRQLDRTARAASDDNRIRQVESRRIGDVRKETRSMERKMEHMDRNREDARRRQNDNRNIQSLEDVERSDRRARISTREDRREDNRQNSENIIQTRSREREMQARDSIRTGIRNIRKDISEDSVRVHGSRILRSAGSDVEMRRLERTARAASDDNRVRQVESRRIGDVRRETRSMERKVERMDRNREDVRRRQNDNRNIRSLEDVERSDRRARISTMENRREDNRRNSENRMQTRSIEREMKARDSVRTGIRNTLEDISEGSVRVRESKSPRSAGLDVEMRRLDRTARAVSDDNRVRQVKSRRIGDFRRETRSMDRKVERMDRNREDIRRRQIDIRNTRSLEDVGGSDRRARISTMENRQENNRRISENRMQTRSIEREMQARDSVRTGIRNTREDISEGSVRVRDSRSPRSVESDVEMRQLDRAARAASDNNRVRQVESRHIGNVRRATRSMERKVDSIQDTIDIRRQNNDIQNSRLLTRNIRSVPDVRRSSMRDQSLSRRDIEVHQQRTTMRRDISRIDENSADSGKMNDVRVVLDGRRSVSRDEMDSRRSSTKRQTAGVFRDSRRSTRETELTRQIGRVLRENGESQRKTRVMQRGMNPMVERATDSTRIIRSEAGRSHLSGTSYRREGEIKRETRSLKMLKPEDGYRVVDEADVRTERYVGDTERSITARFQRSDARSVDGLRRLERQTRFGSYDGETRRVDNRRARESRLESRSMEITDMERRMDPIRSSSAESRDSRAGTPIRLLVRDSRSAKDVRRAERRARIVSNDRDSRRIDNRRDDEDRMRDMNHLGRNINVMRRVDDMRRSDRRAHRAGNDWEIRRVEIRRSKDNRREVRTLERETSSMEGVARRKSISLDNRSSRLLHARSADDTRQCERRTEFDAADRETRRSENRRHIETQREMRNLVVNMNLMEKRRTEMRRIQADSRDIRSTEGMRRSGKAAQLSRTARDVRRVENVRSVDDRREREIRRVSRKPVAVRRTHSEDKDSRFTTAADSQKSDQLRNAREETRRTDRRRDERSQRDVMSRVIDIKSFDESRAETRKASVTIRSVDSVRRIERMARNNPNEIEMRRVLKNPNSRTQDVRRTKIMETRDIYFPETKLARTVKPDSTDRRTISAERVSHKRTALAQNAEQMYGMTQKTDYYGAAKSVVTNWLATFDLKMTDVSRLGETMMYGGILCYALFANVNKKAIF